MTGTVLETLRDEIGRRGEVPVDLRLSYTVVYSTLQGNLPVNRRAGGFILDYPVDLGFSHISVPNTMGAFPVNTRIFGTIGGEPVSARLRYKIVFSTLAGNIPVNTGAEIETPEGTSFLEMPITWAQATARGGGPGGGGGGGIKSKSVIFVKGVMVQPDEIKDSGAGGGPTHEAGRPIPAGLKGRLMDISINLKFSHSYYINTSSGRNPVNTRATGWLRAAGG